METYTILLVDDEEAVIQTIMSKIPWQELGFSIIGYANNGAKALEMIKEVQPDVIMTDIRMPYMDGMELADQVRRLYPDTKILFFTGFDEFEYAKEAVHLEAEEYILKPVNAVELTRIFTRVKTKLDQAISAKRNIETLRHAYQASLPQLQANFFVTLIEGRLHPDDIERQMEDYQLELNGPYLCCLVVHTSSSYLPKDMTPALLATFVQKQAEEQLARDWQAQVFTYLENTILIAQLQREHDISELTDQSDRFCHYVQRISGAVVTIGLGEVCRSLPELAQSYKSARLAVTSRVIYGRSRSINLQEMEPQEQSQFVSANESELPQLIKIIRIGTEEELTQAVDAYMQTVFYPETSLPHHQIYTMELLCGLYRFAQTNDLNAAAFSGDIRTLSDRLLELEAEDLRDWLLKICQSMRLQLVHARCRSTQTYVSRARDFVAQHYMDESLSLDQVCEALGVSNSYFSTIFKKETGNSFIGYLTEYRMQHAARLLSETAEKSYIIARQVGYSDPNYFSYVFKRQFGVAPSRYRTEAGAP
ncbi:response regulator [Oscillospiraceae bacterium HV4-5-C5C]|nr:response regulator [Oscillospiraceae bacterium HV4-5-C5C]